MCNISSSSGDLRPLSSGQHGKRKTNEQPSEEEEEKGIGEQFRRQVTNASVIRRRRASSSAKGGGERVACQVGEIGHHEVDNDGNRKSLSKESFV